MSLYHRALIGSTRDQYHLFVKKYQIEPSTVEIEAGLFGCWLGDQSADETLLWLHGMLRFCFIPLHVLAARKWWLKCKSTDRHLLS